MKFNMKKPCPKRPFRHDITPYVRGERMEEIVSSLIDSDQSFPCHETVDYDQQDENGDFQYSSTGNEEHCAGAAIMLLKYEMPNQAMRIMGRLGGLPDYDMEAPVHSDPDDVINACYEEGDRP